MSIFIEADHMTAEKVAVGTQQADFYQDTNPENANVLVWQSESGDVIFSISAALPKDELVKIAESITVTP